MTSFVEIAGCPVPTTREFDLGVRYVMARCDTVPTTVYRGSERAALVILHRNGKHSQAELRRLAEQGRGAEAGIIGMPNREGESTHDLHAGGAFRGARTRPIPGYQCGQDWPIPEVGDVLEAWNDLNAGAWRPYGSSLNEKQHVCCRRPPRFTLPQRCLALPLTPGDKSPAVRAAQILLKRGRYLPRGFDVADEIGTYGPVMVKAAKRFQHDAHVRVDGVIGHGTATLLVRRYGK